MIPDALPYLTTLRATVTDPEEAAAIDRFLEMNKAATAGLTFLAEAANAVWLINGDEGQLAIPTDLMPDLTARAREEGLLDRFYQELESHVVTMLAQVKMNLFPEAV